LKEEIVMSSDAGGITKEELSRRLRRGDLQLIDVRLNWQTSDLKIVSAVYENPRETFAWAHKYSP
jgi:hypothetical protein